MKKRIPGLLKFYAAIFSLLSMGMLPGALAQKLTQFVDPMIGSGGRGHVFVGASVPFGAMQLGSNNIDKGWDWCSGYHYSESLLIGFSPLHLSGTGSGDPADVLIMPVAGEVQLDNGRQDFPHKGYLSLFSHRKEPVISGFYSVKMDNDLTVELTASQLTLGYLVCLLLRSDRTMVN